LKKKSLNQRNLIKFIDFMKNLFFFWKILFKKKTKNKKNKIFKAFIKSNHENKNLNFK